MWTASASEATRKGKATLVKKRLVTKERVQGIARDMREKNGKQDERKRPAPRAIIVEDGLHPNPGPLKE